MIIRATLVLPVVVQATPYQWHASLEESRLEPALGDGRYHSPSIALIYVVVLFCLALGSSQQHIVSPQSLHRKSSSTLARIFDSQANLASVLHSLHIQTTIVWPTRTISPCFKYQAHSPWRISMWKEFACHQWVQRRWLPVNGRLLVHMWVMQSAICSPSEGNHRRCSFRSRLSDGAR